MSFKKQTPTNKKATDILLSQKTQEVQEKITVEVKKNVQNLTKLCEEITNSVVAKTEELETLRQDFIREENQMMTTREAHLEAMKTLEDETKDKCNEMLETAKKQTEELVKNANTTLQEVEKNKKELVKQMDADYAFKRTQNERDIKEKYLADRQAYFNDFCNEFHLATISKEELESLQEKANNNVLVGEETIKKAVDAAVKELNAAHTLETLRTTSDFERQIALQEPTIQSLRNELKRLEEVVANYKSIIDNDRKAQVEMANSQKFNVNVDATNKK